MGKGSKLFNFDVFSKTLDERKIKTSTGGLITIGCLITTLILLYNEYVQYNTIILRPELVINRDIKDNLKINLDISFPEMPCDLISLDVLDLTGNIEIDLLKNGFTKTRINSQTGEEIEESKFDANQDMDFDKDHTGANNGYCGSCYGSIDQNGNESKEDSLKICCNSCESVKSAYAKAGWKFYDGKDIEQCEKEGYVDRVNARLNEGCRIKGITEINRIGGNLHFAPGASITINGRHVHDMSLFDKHQDKFSFHHKINHFSFGDDSHDLQEIFENDSHNHLTTHPLDSLEVNANNKYQMYTYYLKIVGTRFEYLNGQIIETNEFSATEHNRPLRGGRDDDHPNTIHSRGGIPGLFFYFDISPMKIINREEYNKSLSAFILSLCSTIAGILTVGAILDKTIWSARRYIKDQKSV